VRRLIIIKTTIAKIQSIQRVQTSYKNKISQLALLFEILGGVYRGDGAIAPPPWSDREFLDNFCTVLVSFVLRLNRKIRVARLVRVFCLLKTASKCNQGSFWGQNDFLLGMGPTSLQHTLSLDASPSPYWNPKYATAGDILSRRSFARGRKHMGHRFWRSLL